MTVGKWMTLNPPERRRTYIFPHGTVEFENITNLYVSESGTHYIECKDGKVIVQNGWMAISFDADEWTYPKKE